MKILVTGAGGQIGQEWVALVEEWAREGRYVPCLIPLAKSDCDLRNPQQILYCLALHQPDVIINLAAYTAVDQAETECESAYAVNAEGVKNLALACKAYEVPIIHISTDYVFDGLSNSPYREDDLPAPLQVYGASKWAGEQCLQGIWYKHIILRVSWVFGQYGNNFVKKVLKNASERKALSVVADQWGCPTGARDLAEVLLILAEHVNTGQCQWGVFHYRGDKIVSWYTFAEAILSCGKAIFPLVCQQLSPVTTAHYPTLAIRPKYSVLDVRKIARAYGVKPASWALALDKMIQGMDGSFSG